MPAMSSKTNRSFQTPHRNDLDLRSIANEAGVTISALPNGTLFAIEHGDEKGTVLVNQVLGSPIYGGIGRLYLRIGGAHPHVAEIVGPKARVDFGHDDNGYSWSGVTQGVRHTVSLRLHPSEAIWFWQVSLAGQNAETIPADLILVQDVGLGDQGFLMGSEAYASQYIDHHIADHPVFGTVIMNRQNLKQSGARNPWLVQGCLQGAAGYATDAIQLVAFGMADGRLVPEFGSNLESVRRQHEVACPSIQSKPLSLRAGFPQETTFFALSLLDHPDASGDGDLSRLDSMLSHADELSRVEIVAKPGLRSLLQDAPLAAASSLDDATIDRLYPRRQLEERIDGRLLSFFVSEGFQNRHVVLREKELAVARRHGAIVRSGPNMMPDERTLAATCWMQGIFAAQLTIGNTSFHKLFSVSRDPYNLTRASGLRILVESGQGWELLAVPSVFEMGLSDCRWIYQLADRTITVSSTASGEDPAMQWRVAIEGTPCRLLIFGHIVLGEREFESGGSVEFDTSRKRISFKPDPGWIWGERFPEAAYHLVTSTADAVETMGGDELLYADGRSRGGPVVVLKSRSTDMLCFAVVGSMTDAAAGEALADRYEAGVHERDMLASASRFWRHVTRNLELDGNGSDVSAQALILPWLAHDAIVHLSVPHGLEQYTGAAWGTRDACQGPVEFLLAYEHDSEVRQLLTTLFAEQYHDRGDWPQWFMLEPYSNIRSGESHGDIVVWPLKALCDYIEATGDFAFLDEVAPWREDATSEKSMESSTIADHVEKLLGTVRDRFIPGTHLIRYGEGDWNDSLQPADPHLRDWMVSSWTVALLYEQIVRYAAIMDHRDQTVEARELVENAEAMRSDFNRFLVRDGIVAGYGLFDPGHDGVELLLHPEDRRTGLHYSLISMTQAMLGGLFTPEQRRDHMRLIADNLSFPDGVRLMEKPAKYSGGPETLFRRAESSSFFGREIGLMYVHAHLRYCEALAIDGDAAAVWDALSLINPIAVTEQLAHASLRQRNTYFSSSDAAFPDRYRAASEWDRVRSGTIAADGGWRTYSSGPGLYARSFLQNVLGFKRQHGRRVRKPLLPRKHEATRVTLDFDA
jgi:1,2-beta-oligoglucan phosphorylase